MITRSGANNEVWQDQRTELLWSSKYSGIENWCRATGNAQSNDPSTYCYNTTYQPQYPTAESLCSEIGTVAVPGSCSNNGFYATSGACTGAGGTWTAYGEDYTNGVYSAKKGGMGKISSATSPSVVWRSPTISDYKQADVNGIRFVMPDMSAAANIEWSSTVISNLRGSAWTFVSARGNITAGARTLLTNYARCVGR